MRDWKLDATLTQSYKINLLGDVYIYLYTIN